MASYGDDEASPVNPSLEWWASRSNVASIAATMQSYQAIASRIDGAHVPQPVSYAGRPPTISSAGSERAAPRPGLQTCVTASEWIEIAQKFTQKLSENVELGAKMESGETEKNKNPSKKTIEKGPATYEAVVYPWGFAPTNQPLNVPTASRISSWPELDAKMDPNESIMQKKWKTINDFVLIMQAKDYVPPKFHRVYLPDIAKSLYKHRVLEQFVTSGFIIHGNGWIVQDSCSVFTSALIAEIADFAVMDAIGNDASRQLTIVSLTCTRRQIRQIKHGEMTPAAKILAVLCGSLRKNKQFAGPDDLFCRKELVEATAWYDRKDGVTPYMKVFRELIIGSAQFRKRHGWSHQIITVTVEAEDQIDSEVKGANGEQADEYPREDSQRHKGHIGNTIHFFRSLCDELVFGGLNKYITFTYIIVHGGICSAARYSHPNERQIFLPTIKGEPKNIDQKMTAVAEEAISFHKGLHPLFSMPGIGAPRRETVWEFRPITALDQAQFVERITGEASKDAPSMSNDNSDPRNKQPVEKVRGDTDAETQGVSPALISGLSWMTTGISNNSDVQSAISLQRRSQGRSNARDDWGSGHNKEQPRPASQGQGSSHSRENIAKSG